MIIVSFLFAACSGPKTKTLFTLLDNKSTGIHFNNINAENEKVNILTYEYLYNGGGVAIGDINNDGLKDVYFTSNNLENKLYLNKGNFQFEDITNKAGAGCKPGWKTGVTMADVNADGWLDIYVCKSADGTPEKRANILLINNGISPGSNKNEVTFTDRSKEYGVDDQGYSTHASFFDYDNDGDLDLFVLNHSLIEVSNTIGIEPSIRSRRHPDFSNKLFRNNNGKFTDVSEEAGIVGGMANYGLGIAVSDFNNDGWQDIYVTNDYAENDHLYINNKKGQFTDSIYACIDHMSNFSMGVDVADFNNDGLQDICTLDMLPEDNKRQKLLYGPNEYDKFNLFVKSGLHYQYMRNMLQLNNGNGRFSEIGQLAGISNTDWSWAPLIADFDNDGNPDLFVSNGYKRDFTNMDFLKYKADVQLKVRSPRTGAEKVPLSEIIKKMPSNKFHNYMFKSNGDLTFANVSKDWGFETAVLNNGAAYADLDNDGDLDLVTNNIDQEAFVYRNNTNELYKNNYLTLRLTGNGFNRYGVGAKVKVYFNNQVAFKECNPARGFQSSVDMDMVFGLGNTTAVDSMEVIWPSGNYETLKNVKPNQRLELLEKNAVNKYNYNKPAETPYFLTDNSKAFEFTHKENNFIDFGVQSLLPRFYSTQGPRMAKADVNNDGLEDIYICGASGQSGQLFLQQPDERFQVSNQLAFLKDSLAEDIDAALFDVDQDKDLDLFVVSGGYQFSETDPKLLTRLYTNDGKGNFQLKEGHVNVMVNASCVKPADADGDGDLDVFIGGRVLPGKYPLVPKSYLLINDGKGNFTDQTTSIAPSLQTVGMVTDALWIDINNDTRNDLIVVGEWMPIKIFLNEQNKLIDKSSSFFGESNSGWWNRIYGDDFDKDGDLDFIAGNLGKNSQIKASKDQPCTLVYDDFDKNGSVDPLMCYYIQGKSYPSLSRDELIDQMPSLRKKFNDYASYSNATITDIISPENLSAAKKLQAEQFATCYIENTGNGKLLIKELPIEAQVSPVYAIASFDANNDGNKDLFLGGNFEKTRVSMGKFDANHGQLFLGDGNGNFKYITQTKSGFNLKGDVKDAVIIKTKNKSSLIFSINNAPVSCYWFNN